MGTVAVPLPTQTEKKVKAWYPIRSFTHTLEEAYAIYDNIEILVETEVVLSSVELSHSINDRMVDVFSYNRSIDGQVELPRQSSLYEKHQAVIPDCYEWLWQLGFTGHDPLILDRMIVSQSNSESNDPGDPSASLSPTNTTNGAPALPNKRRSRGQSAGGGGELQSLSDDEGLSGSAVIELEKSFSTSDVLKPRSSGSSPVPAATAMASGGGGTKKRASRVKYVNKASLPDSDDEFPTGAGDE